MVIKGWVTNRNTRRSDCIAATSSGWLAFPVICKASIADTQTQFGQAPAERAQETSAAQRTIYRRIQRFEAEGMTSLFVDAT
jgi:hypothetical protein